MTAAMFDTTPILRAPRRAVDKENRYEIVFITNRIDWEIGVQVHKVIGYMVRSPEYEPVFKEGTWHKFPRLDEWNTPVAQWDFSELNELDTVQYALMMPENISR